MFFTRPASFYTNIIYQMGRTRHLRYWTLQANRNAYYQPKENSLLSIRVDDNALVTKKLKRAIHLKLCLLPTQQKNRSFWRSLYLRFVLPRTANMAIAHPRLTAMVLGYYVANDMEELEQQPEEVDTSRRRASIWPTVLEYPPD